MPSKKLKAKPASPKEKDLRVWWMPQIGCNATFHYPVADIHEAKILLDALAKYDLFQLENNIKPDFSNAGGLQVFEQGEWLDWCDEETGEGIDDVKDPGPLNTKLLEGALDADALDFDKFVKKYGFSQDHLKQAIQSRLAELRRVQ